LQKRKRAEFERQENLRKEEELRRMHEMRQLEERKLLERQQIEAMMEKESKVTKGQVTRRSDDPFGQGFGFVKTGFVSSKKLSFLQRASSLEPYDSRGVSPAPSQGSGKTKLGLRVTWAESPTNSRPGSNLGWTEKVAEMDAEALRAQTPPLAAEWAVSKGSETKSFSQSTMSFASNRAVSSNNQMITSENNLNGNTLLATQSVTDSKSAISSSFTKSSGSQMMSSMQSSQSSAFSSSQIVQSSSNFQSSSNMSQTFEAFPGMGRIENLNLEGSKAGK